MLQACDKLLHYCQIDYNLLQLNIFLCFPIFPQIDVTKTNHMFVPQKVKGISERSIDTAQLPRPLPYNLPPPFLNLDSEESAAEDSSTSDEEWDSGATAAKPRAGNKKSKAQGSKQGHSSCESIYKGRSSGVVLRHDLRGNNPLLTGASHDTLQVLPSIHIIRLPAQDPCNYCQCCYLHCKKGLVNPTDGLLINTLYDVLNQHMPLLGIVRVTM